MITGTLADIRRFYAAEIECAANIRTPGLVDAFAEIPREQFLGPGPWRIGTSDPRRPTSVVYRETPDADPRRVYHNVAIALDATRNLNNGHPSSLAMWLDALRLAPGESLLHIGCGVGYYTAIAASTVGSAGRVTAIEMDETLAGRARENLEPYAQVRVVAGDGAIHHEPNAYDAILVNAGFTHPLSDWLESLAPSGRLLLPITAAMPRSEIGVGAMTLITRAGEVWRAEVVSPVAIFNSPTARDEHREGAIRRALASGAWPLLKTLRLDPHEPEANCVVHGATTCLSAA
jgi:protein-L-isoaspartate(D-aspartate) O-methyltransferase